MTHVLERDVLFLTQPGFADEAGKTYYCGDSLPVEGLLSLFPALRDKLDVQSVPFARPRSAVIALLGEANQSLPVLVVAKAADAEGFGGKQSGDVVFIDDEAEIRRYLSTRHGLPFQH